MEIVVKVDAPELCQAIYALAEALRTNNVVDLPKRSTVVTEPSGAGEPANVATTEPAAMVTKEDLRKRLAGLASAGQQEKIKDLFACFNAKKLTEVDPAKYGELLALLDEAEVA